MKLNLACGDDVREGYVNVDFRQTHHSVVVADLSKFPWNMSTASAALGKNGIFNDTSADEIMLLDALEHFPYATTQTILMECRRILKPDGTLIVQVPDGLHTARALIQEGEYLCNKCGRGMVTVINGVSLNLSSCPGCKTLADDISQAAMKRLYGGQDYVGNFHQVCFTKRLLTEALTSAGFNGPKWLEESHQWANWSLKCETTPGDLW